MPARAGAHRHGATRILRLPIRVPDGHELKNSEQKMPEMK
jgi:hypothetical protein